MCALSPHTQVQLTLENCLAFSSWFQHRKGYASVLRGRGRVRPDRQSSPVSGPRPPWWIMLPNNGRGLSQSEHAPIAGRHTNMPLFPFPLLSHQNWHCPLANAGLQYVFIFTNECPSFGWKANKKQAITLKRFNRACCVMNGITHGTGPITTACLWRWNALWITSLHSFISNESLSFLRNSHDNLRTFLRCGADSDPTMRRGKRQTGDFWL